MRQTGANLLFETVKGHWRTTSKPLYRVVECGEVSSMPLERKAPILGRRERNNEPHYLAVGQVFTSRIWLSESQNDRSITTAIFLPHRLIVAP